jgi:hypothetical protein
MSRPHASAPCPTHCTQGTTWGQHLTGVFWGLTSVTVSLLDWPLRNLTGGRLASAIRPVRSSTAVSGVAGACLDGLLGPTVQCATLHAVQTQQLQYPVLMRLP